MASTSHPPYICRMQHFNQSRYERRTIAISVRQPHDKVSPLNTFFIGNVMTSTYVLLGLMLIVYIFWQQRRQDERATQLAMQLCQHHQVQFLECARQGYGWQQGKGLLARYQVDFSGDGQSRYQATLTMRQLRLAHFEMPAFKI